MFGVIRGRRLLAPHLPLRVELRCEVLRLLLVVEIIVFAVAFLVVFIFVVRRVQAGSHGAPSDLVIEKFFAMLVVVGDLKNLGGVVILHAETIIIVIHWVVKGVKIVLTHYLWLLMLLFGLLLWVSILSVGSCHTRSSGSAPEISVDLLGHLISTRGCSPSSSSHYCSLEVKVARH